MEKATENPLLFCHNLQANGAQFSKTSRIFPLLEFHDFGDLRVEFLISIADSYNKICAVLHSL